MAKFAVIEGDIVQSVTDDQDQEIETIPVALESLPASQLRWNETGVVDASTETNFWIDDLGVKHVQNLAPQVGTVPSQTALTTGVDLQFKRNGAGPDTIERTVGSFIDDGFTVGMKITVTGSSNNNETYTVDGVTALVLTVLTNSAVANEGPSAGIRIDGGWQYMPGINFSDVLVYDPDQDNAGAWVVQSNDDLLKADKNSLIGVLKSKTDQYFDDNYKIGDRFRDSADLTFQMFEVLDQDDQDTPTFTDIAKDLKKASKRIYDEDVIVDASSVNMTFADNGASADTITRNDTGSFNTDGWKTWARVKVTGSASNNGNYSLASKTSKILTLGPNDSLTNETVTCDVTGKFNLFGFKNLRDTNLQQEYDDLIRTSVVQQWIDSVKKTEKNTRNDINNATIWAVSTSYVLDDTVWDSTDRKFYKATTTHTSGTTTRAADSANWDLISTDLVYDPFPASQLNL